VEYRLEADWQVYHFLRALPKAEERRLVSWIGRLQDFPFLEGDFGVRDAIGRNIQVTRVGRFFVYHWSDHGVKTIRVNKIEEIN